MELLNAKHLYYSKEDIMIANTLEESLNLEEHKSKYAACTPNIYRRSVMSFVKKHLWRLVRAAPKVRVELLVVILEIS